MRKTTQSILLKAIRASTATPANAIASASVSLGMSTVVALTNAASLAANFSTRQPTLEKIGNVESLLTKITSAENMNDVLMVYQDNADIYKCEHLAQTARMLARLAPKRNEIMSINRDPKYTALIAQIAKSMKKFNESELLDLLFWARKFKNHRGAQEPVHLEIMDRVIEASKRDSYELRQCGTIYFDLSVIGARNCDEVAGRLISKINADPSQLTTFVAMNVLQSVTQKGSLCSGKELILVDVVCKHLPSLLSQLDITQKSLIFHQIAEIEPFIHPPKYKMPSVMFTIKSELKEQVDSLNENSVLHVLNAYKHLIYSHFPVDLLEEIKEMVVVTVQHHSANIKSSFLLDFIETLMLINKKRRTDQAKLRILVNDLTKRVKDNDALLLSGHRLDQLIAYCDKYLKAKSTLIKLLSEKADKIFQTSFNASLVELVAKKGHPEDFDRILEEYFGTTPASITERIQVLNASTSRVGIIARLTVCVHPHRERHQSLYDQLVKITEDRIETDPLVVLVAFKQTNLFNQLKKELMIKTVNKYIKVNALADTEGQIARAILSSVDLKESRQIWHTYLKNKPVDNSFVTKFLELYFSHEGQENYERLTVLMNVLYLSGENFPLRLILTLMKDNSVFLEELAKHEILFRRLLVLIFEAAKRNPEHIKLINLYQMCLRLESIGLRLDYFYKIMSQIFEVQANNSSNESSVSFITFLFQTKLADNGLLRVSSAKAALSNKHVVDNQSKAKFLAIIAQQDAEYFKQNKESYDALFKSLLNQLNSSSAAVVKKISFILTQMKNDAHYYFYDNQALNSATAILRLPTSYFLSEGAFVIKVIKENLSNVHDTSTFTQMFLALPLATGDGYAILVKELVEHFIQVKKRIPFTEIRRVLQKMSELQIRDARILTSILQDIGSNFYSMTQEDRVVCLQSYCNMYVKQDDFIERSLQDICEHTQSYRSQYITIVNSLFKVGYTSELLCDFIAKCLRFQKLSYEEYAISLALIAIIPDSLSSLKLPLISDIASKLSNPDSYYLSNQSHYTNMSILAVCTAYYSTFHSDHPEILKFLDKYKGNQDKGALKAIYSHSGYQSIHKYLAAMGIDSTLNEIIHTHEIPLSIPSAKLIVKVNNLSNLNFDRQTVGGKTILEEKILESIPDYSVITINLHEFNNSGSQLNRINYLIQKGINCDPKKTYDLSKCNESAITSSSSEELTTLGDNDFIDEDINILGDEELIEDTK